MINGFRIYDADAHVNVAPQMWEDLPKEFAARRPRPALIHDNDELAYFTVGWLTDGRMEPHALSRACSRRPRRFDRAAALY